VHAVDLEQGLALARGGAVARPSQGIRYSAKEWIAIGVPS
jgi:hypothetical protein